MWDDRIDLFDARIDAVAQQMTVGEPRADLRARVLDRIAAQRPRSISVAWRLSLAPVAIVAIVLLVVLFRSGHPLPSHPTPTFVDGPPYVPHVVDAVVKTPPNVSAASRAARLARAPLAAPTPGHAELIAHLQMEPLTVQPMQLPAIETPQSTPPEAIGLTRLTVVPLSSEGEP